jgi:hypothetical protein
MIPTSITSKIAKYSVKASVSRWAIWCALGLATGLVVPVSAQTIASPSATVGGANPAIFLNDVGGRTPQFCSISAASLSNTAQVINVKALTGATLEIETLVNPTTLITQGASVQLAMQAVCNYPHELTLSSANNGLWRQSPTNATPPAPFASAVPYAAIASWGAQQITINADTGSRRPITTNSSIDQPQFGEITLSLTVDPGASNVTTNSPLLAGSYSDLITITLGPQP